MAKDDQGWILTNIYMSLNLYTNSNFFQHKIARRIPSDFQRNPKTEINRNYHE